MFSMLVRIYFLGLILILCLVSLPGCLSPEFAQFKSSFINFQTASLADPKPGNWDRTLIQYQLDKTKVLLDLSEGGQGLRPEGYWPDIIGGLNEINSVLDTKKIKNHVERVSKLLEAYTLSRRLYLPDGRMDPETGLEISSRPELVGAINRSFSVMLQMFQAKLGNWDCPVGCDNFAMPVSESWYSWYFWEIEIAKRLMPFLVVSQQDLDTNQVDRFLKLVKILIEADQSPIRESDEKFVGANLTWRLENLLAYSLAVSDEALAHNVVVWLERALQPSLEDGVKGDGSFHQHGPLFYTGGYGKSFQESVGKLLAMTNVYNQNATEFRVGNASIETFARFVLEGSDWMLVDNYWDPISQGREIVRFSNKPVVVPIENCVLAVLEHSRTQEAKGVFRRLASVSPDYGNVRYGDLHTRAAALITADPPDLLARIKRGFRFFSDSDFGVFKGSHFHASYRMHSTRTENYEMLNGEGKSLWFSSAGSFWLTDINPNELYFKDRNLIAFDWLKVPGVTELGFSSLDLLFGLNQQKRGTSSFVGGQSYGDVGLATMQYESLFSPVKIKKSVFFLADQVLFLGTDLTYSDPALPPESINEERYIYTTVNQRVKKQSKTLYVDGAPYLVSGNSDLVNPSALFHDGVGYLFLQNSRVKVRNRIQRGKVCDFLNCTGSDEVSLPGLILQISHGQASNIGYRSYAYSVVPQMSSPQALAEFAATNQVNVIENSSLRQHVRYGDNFSLYVNFAPQKYGGMQVNGPSTVVVRQLKGAFEISVSDLSAPAANKNSTELVVSVLDGSGARHFLKVDKKSLKRSKTARIPGIFLY